MPFRAHRRFRYQGLVLPVFAITCLVMMVLWVVFCFSVLGGWGKSSASQRLFVFGFVAIPLFQVIGTVVTVFLLETAAYDNFNATLARLQSLAAIGTIYVVDQTTANSLDDLAYRLQALGTIVIVRDKAAADVLGADAVDPAGPLP